MLAQRNGNVVHGEEYLSDNASNITNDGGIRITDVSNDSGIESKEMKSLINKQAERGDTLTIQVRKVSMLVLVKFVCFSSKIFK